MCGVWLVEACGRRVGGVCLALRKTLKLGRSIRAPEGDLLDPGSCWAFSITVLMCF